MPDFTLPKTYDFKSTESRIYEMWEKSGYFKPKNDPNQPGFDPSIKTFVISIPPPNVTGELHLGHAMFVSMEDLMIRYHRMKGYATLWVPGSDHAGIATQLQVEKALAKEGTSREKIGREEFLKRTWQWNEKYGGIIYQQIRRLGASCDWERVRFTLDEGLSKSVREGFVRLYKKGLIYRGPRLINWSPGLKTAVSDLEVEYSQEPGTLYYFKYMVAGSQDEFIPVATTRPETILGDTAVCVHPEDDRYRKYIGQKVIVPILGREVPVIADAYVEREFGTGALKITPGHDQNDYEISQRHKLPMLSIMDESARINEHGGPYQGLDRFDCRKKIWEDMRSAGLVLKEEAYTLTVPRSQRGGEIIEPMISTQWFVHIQPLADAALEAVRDGRITIVPERFTKVYYNWLENIKDWCISRQLWWGHRVPVWYAPDGTMFCAHNEEEATQQARQQFGTDVHLEQDEDVLDTWFSSGLWPFSTLGWPDNTPDLGYFYPTAMMETGYDILFFWVARMIMMGLEFTGEVPFQTVYLHGLIRDEHGRKMSKSYGNVIDPLIVMDEMGTDALRFTLLVGSTPGNDMSLSVKKVESNRNFANKVWNAGRYVINAISQAPAQGNIDWSLADSWIWARLQTLVRDVERLFQNYQYGEAGRQIYEFFWNDFADWYVELAKLQLAEGGDRAYTTADTLIRVLDTSLRLLHPFTPYITEELWGYLKEAAPQGKEWGPALIVADWPMPLPEEDWETQKVADFSLMQEVVRVIRNLRAEKQVKPGQRTPAILIGGDRTPLLRDQAAAIAVLAKLDADKLTILEHSDGKPEGHVALVAGPVEIYLPLAGLVDTEEERIRIEKDIQDTEVQIERLEKLLGSSFAEKAKAEVVQKERDRLAGFKETAQKLRTQLQAL